MATFVSERSATLEANLFGVVTHATQEHTMMAKMRKCQKLLQGVVVHLLSDRAAETSTLGFSGDKPV